MLSEHKNEEHRIKQSACIRSAGYRTPRIGILYGMVYLGARVPPYSLN